MQRNDVFEHRSWGGGKRYVSSGREAVFQKAGEH